MIRDCFRVFPLAFEGRLSPGFCPVFRKGYKALKSKGINAKVMDAANLKFKSRSFDLVFSDGLLEHFKEEEDIRRIVKEQLRVSKKYVINFIPKDNLINIVLEKIQRVPKEYRNREWVRIHKSAFPKGKNYKIYVKELFRLDAFIVKKS